MLFTLNVTVVVTVMFPLVTLLMGVKQRASDLGDRDILGNGGLAHLGGGGGGVVLTLLECVGECGLLQVGNVCGCVICA